MFRRIAVLGTGLIGGSFALAVRRRFPGTRIAGWDRPEVLRKAVRRGMIHKSCAQLAEAVQEADLVYVALPICATLKLLPEIARHAPATALITDACSTKVEICRAAREAFGGGGRFVGGHPIAGKERSGVENADARMFRGARYALIGRKGTKEPRRRELAALLRRIGARPVWMDAAAHDRATALLSHLPQLVAVALANAVQRGIAAHRIPLALAGSGLRDTLRLAGSPGNIWEEICLTNRKSIGEALEEVAAAIQDVQKQLGRKALRKNFKAANEFHKAIGEMK